MDSSRREKKTSTWVRGLVAAHSRPHRSPACPHARPTCVTAPHPGSTSYTPTACSAASAVVVGPMYSRWSSSVSPDKRLRRRSTSATPCSPPGSSPTPHHSARSLSFSCQPAFWAHSGPEVHQKRVSRALLSDAVDGATERGGTQQQQQQQQQFQHHKQRKSRAKINKNSSKHAQSRQKIVRFFVTARVYHRIPGMP